LLRRHLGSKNFDNSPPGGYPKNAHYIDESGRNPKPADIDRVALLALFRSRLRPEAPKRPTPERFTDIELGARDTENPLPTHDYKDLIVETIHQHQVSIIVAETGAGKSTQVPQYLLEAGYTVNLTQPRRLASNMLSERIGDEIVDAIGSPEARHLVGLHTAEHNTVTDYTRITVLTDGLRLVQELNARGDIENEVLIIDEVHEWNKNIEVLVAWTKNVIKEKPNLRVVLMSATMDAHRLADYFGKNESRPPIIEIPGRTYEVEKKEEPGSTVYEQVVAYAKQDKNILVFLPGVREIGDMQIALEKTFEVQNMMDVTVLPLHGKLSDQEQKAVDREYPGVKIILATNVAQTSLTINDIDVVVDSGLERRVEIDFEGIQSLRLHAISKADADQRAGRAGRTHEGIYVLTPYEWDPDMPHVPYIKRDDYPMPEILRSDIDQNTLAVAGAGLRLSDLELFHPLERESLRRSEHGLTLLGALEDGRITPRGRRMNEFPVHPTLARMLVESENYSNDIRTYMSAIVASFEVGKLPSYLYNASRDWRELTDESESDHLAQLDIFIATQDMNAHELSVLGLDIRNISRARELHEKISRRSQLAPQPLIAPSDKQRAEIVECVASGMVDFVYKVGDVGGFTRLIGRTATQRMISNRSLTAHGSSKLIVGTPYQFTHPEKGEQRVIEGVTAVTASTLGKVAGNLCTWKDSGEFTWRGGVPKVDQYQVFRDTVKTGMWREQPAQPSPELRSEIIRYSMENPGNAQKALRVIKKELELLRRLAGSIIPQFTHEDLETYIQKAAPKDIADPSLIDEYLRRNMAEENITLDAFVPPEVRAKVYENSPPSIEKDGRGFNVRYSNGVAKIHLSDALEAASLSDEIYLPDGRHVQLVYKKKGYSVVRLKEMLLPG
jgi:HrpA-like RNA helicase